MPPRSWSNGATAEDAAASATPPVVVQHVDAEYPASALPLRKHADVKLTITSDVDGHVSKVDVTESSGHADLDEAAVVAVRQWTLVPAMRDDKPIASRISVPFHFAPPAPAPEMVDTTQPNALPARQAVPQVEPTPTAAASPAAPAPTEAAVPGGSGRRGGRPRAHRPPERTARPTTT